MKSKLILIILTLLTLLSGCNGGDRDSTIIELHSGYAILFVNSGRVVLGKARPHGLSHEILIPNYFVTEYIVEEEALFIKGIITKDKYATETEKNSNDFAYYIVDAKEESIIGPFFTEDELWERADQLGALPPNDWVIAKHPK